jgi:hypothetical protein
MELSKEQEPAWSMNKFVEQFSKSNIFFESQDQANANPKK